MKETPILFSGPMVRAILDGRKSVTRRIVKPQPRKNALAGESVLCGPEWNFFNRRNRNGKRNGGMVVGQAKCPYGIIGDRLIVRETWAPGPGCTYYRADYTGSDPWPGKWKPSIHMPHKHSRLTLEITGVRVERVRDISAKDIIAEGVVDRPHKVEGLSGDCPVSAVDGICYPDLRSVWYAAWAKINGMESLKANPWVWVVSFKRAELERTVVT